MEHATNRFACSHMDSALKSYAIARKLEIVAYAETYRMLTRGKRQTV